MRYIKKGGRERERGEKKNILLVINIVYYSPSAPKYEVVRCLMTLAGDVALCHYGFYGAPGYRPTFVTVLQALFTASLALWSFVIYQNAMKTKKVE